MTAAIQVNAVEKSFGNVQIIRDLNLSVAKGERHAIIGPNGAGKSTILKVLNGVHVPEEGEIEVGGQKLAAHSPEAARAAGIAETLPRKAAKAEKRERRSTDYQPTPLWYKVVMIGLMILGLLWIITYYLFQGMVPIPGISVWNLVIGLGFMLAGLIMTTRWR